jgi:hypothetical protein
MGQFSVEKPVAPGSVSVEVNSLISAPVATSQTRTDLSSDQVTMRMPLGLNIIPEILLPTFNTRASLRRCGATSESATPISAASRRGLGI